MGILLLILLILILLILAVLFFVPIRWETGAKAARLPQSSFRAFLKVRWLAGALCFQVRANEKTIAVRLKLFGRVFRQTAFRWRYPFAEEDGPERQISKEMPKAKTAPEPVKSPEPKRISEPRKTPEPVNPENRKVPEPGRTAPMNPEPRKVPEPERTVPEKTENRKASEPKRTTPEKIVPERFSDSAAPSARVSESGKKSSESAEDMEESLIDWAKTLWTAIHKPENERMMGLVKEQALRVLRHLQPQVVRVHAVVGLSDPAETGILLGTFYAFWPLFADAGDFRLAGDFERKTLEGKCYLKGRIRNAVFVSAAFHLFRDREIRSRIISYFKD